MVIAPFIVWATAALIAGVTAGPVWSGAPYVAYGLAAAFGGYVYYRDMTRRTAGRARRIARDAAIPDAVKRVTSAAAPEPDATTRELSVEDLSAVRYIFERALQPVDQFGGFDIVDQFQTSSLRYQINNAGWVLAEIQANYTPNARGYLATAQENLIEKYLQKKVWSYWAYETSWGHLNLANHDPVAKDNIMLTGWLALHTGMHALATGSRRYFQPGSLTFRKPGGKAYVHDTQDLVSSVVGNYEVAPFCLYPCEPNWVYPICNHVGITGLVVTDAVEGTHHAAELKDRWLANLDREFTDESGSIVGLRSSLTCIRFPFPGGELGFVQFMEAVEPARAWRMWAVARQDLDYVMAKTDTGEARLGFRGRGFDFGNYRGGWGGAFAAIGSAAREFGDDGLAEAALRSLDVDCGRTVKDGVLRYEKMSNLSNISAVLARVRRHGDYIRAVKQGPGEARLKGPMLTGFAYPDVLVARAYSATGADLDLVVHPGKAPGVQTMTVEQLTPGGRYSVSGALDETLTADAEGRAILRVNLKNRTALHIAPMN